jgi:hypothetical protein
MADYVYVLPGADLVPRDRRVCAGCGKTRLTTRTNIGPVCNDCLAEDLKVPEDCYGRTTGAIYSHLNRRCSRRATTEVLGIPFCKTHARKYAGIIEREGERGERMVEGFRTNPGGEK